MRREEIGPGDERKRLLRKKENQKAASEGNASRMKQ